MPIYEYQCDNCGHSAEIMQKISDPLLTTCPHCHQATFKQLISATGFQLKGTGWYVTDFRNKDKKDKEKPATETKSTSTESTKPQPEKKKPPTSE